MSPPSPKHSSTIGNGKSACVNRSKLLHVTSPIKRHFLERPLPREKHTRNYGPIRVRELFPRVIKTFLLCHPCRVFSVSYG